MKPEVGDKVLIESTVVEVFPGGRFRTAERGDLLLDPRVYAIGQACIEEFKAARAYVDSPSIEAVERHIAAKKQRDRLTREYLDDEKSKA